MLLWTCWNCGSINFDCIECNYCSIIDVRTIGFLYIVDEVIFLEFKNDSRITKDIITSVIKWRKNMYSKSILIDMTSNVEFEESASYFITSSEGLEGLDHMAIVTLNDVSRKLTNSIVFFMNIFWKGDVKMKVFKNKQEAFYWLRKKIIDAKNKNK